jgi:hypothetical protein
MRLFIPRLLLGNRRHRSARQPEATRRIYAVKYNIPLGELGLEPE